MIIGNKDEFGFEIKKISEENHISELKMFVKGQNICAWKKEEENRFKSVRWNLDDLIVYLNETLSMLKTDDQFPFDVDGECAAEMDNNSREYEVNSDELMDEYYDKLNDWSYKHSWHHAAAGAILADVFFRRVKEGIEVSWWSDQTDEGIIFKNSFGFTVVPISTYSMVISSLIDEYNGMWK